MRCPKLGLGIMLVILPPRTTSVEKDEEVVIVKFLDQRATQRSY